MARTVGDSPAVPEVIGSDRDVAAITAAVLGGRTVVLSGPVGTGKSYLIDAVIVEMARRGTIAVRVRTGNVIARVPRAALDLCSDERMRAALNGETPEGHLVVVVDDVQELDSDSAAALATFVLAERATLVLSISTTSATDPSPGRDLASELWLDGMADRWDLHELDRRDATALLNTLPDAARLDSVTRAAIIEYAAGSRRLLLEATAEAASHAQLGRDPLPSIANPAPGGRLAAATDATVIDLTEEEAVAAAFLGRVPGLGYALALRFLDGGVIDRLIGRRIVMDDGTPQRNLYADPLLAHAAERRSSPGTVNAKMEEACSRMLQVGAAWWSDPLAAHIAERWHRNTAPHDGELDAEVRTRVLTSAAKWENDHGNSTLALDYDELIDFTQRTVESEFEACRALSQLRQEQDAVDRLTSINLATVEPPMLTRIIRWWQALWVSGAHDYSVDVLEHRLLAAGRSEASSAVAAALLRAERAALALRWDEAHEIAEAVAYDDRADRRTRLAACLVTGVASAHLGLTGQARAAFAQAERIRLRTTSPEPAAELWILCFEVLAGTAEDTEPEAPGDRITAAIERAVRTGDPLALALAGLCTGIIAAGRGDHATAVRDLSATGRRASPLAVGRWLPLLQFTLAPALSFTGRDRDAQAALDSVDPALLNRSAIFRLARKNAEALIQRTKAEDIETPTGPVGLIDSTTPLSAAAFTSRPYGLRQDARSSAAMTGQHPGRHVADDLTRREWEIALLVERGLSNREIAQRLFLSIRTVESHIYQARTKVHAHTRRELGRLVADEQRRRQHT